MPRLEYKTFFNISTPPNRIWPLLASFLWWHLIYSFFFDATTNIKACLDAGADDYLTKPLEYEKLLTAISG